VGQVATGPRGQSTLRRTAAVNPAPARPGAQRVSAFAPAPVDEQAAPTAASPPDTSASPFADVIPVAVTTPRELARNPFVIALAALGAVLIIAGAVWAYEGFATIIKNGGTRNEVEFWAAQTMSFGAPLAIVVGLGIAAVLLVMFGRSWQRSR
jgi:hypothetical protein